MIPKVSVLMPVYNGEKYLKQAIDSILSQTFSAFEFLIIDDGSEDSSAEIISSYIDPRIRLVRNERNLGIEESLNKGIALSKSKYIARMDCDDISYPQRLAKQIDFMEKNPEIAVCGSWVNVMGLQKKEVWQYPADHDSIYCNLLFNSVLAHPSVIIRKEILTQLDLVYDSTFKRCEDYDLWVRLCEQNQKLANLEDILLDYRCEPGQGEVKQPNNAHLIRVRQLNHLNINPSNEEIKINEIISTYHDFFPSQQFLKTTESWLRKIYLFNSKIDKYPKQALSEVLTEKWLEVIWSSTRLGCFTWEQYSRCDALFHDSHLLGNMTLLSKFKLLSKCFLRI